MTLRRRPFPKAAVEPFQILNGESRPAGGQRVTSEGTQKIPSFQKLRRLTGDGPALVHLREALKQQGSKAWLEILEPCLSC